MAPVPEPTTPPRSPAASPFTLRAAFRRQTALTIALPLLAVCVVIGIAGHAVLAGLLIAALLLVLAAVRLLLHPRGGCPGGALAGHGHRRDAGDGPRDRRALRLPEPLSADADAAGSPPQAPVIPGSSSRRTRASSSP